jgi:uncharacterized OB-fold protein
MSDMTLPKPRPVPTPVSRPFWEGLNEERVVLQRCDDCNTWVYYPRVRCPRCLSDRLSWHEVSGRGTVFSFTVTHQPTAPPFADEMPQVLVIVELDEGVRVTSTLVDPEPGKIRIGGRVEPVFDHGDDGNTLLRFRLTD